MANDSDKLQPAYLVNGQDELKRTAVVKRLRDRIAQRGDLSFNCDEFNGENAVGEDIVAACNTLPFASDIRLVQVDNADKLKKADQEALVTYLDSPNDQTVLALVSASLARNTRLSKSVAAHGPQCVIDCAPKKRRELPALVRAMATSHGATITDSAAVRLIELVGENTVSLDAQLQKLALAHNGSDPIGDGEVSSLVSRTAEVKPWEFVDAFASRNSSKCLALLQKMDSVSPYSLLAMCVTRIRELISAKSLEQRGQGNQLARVLKLPDWRVKNHMMWARRFDDVELRAALLSARDAEKDMKSGSDPDERFKQWFLEVISR